jgi:hypothetical protein
MHRDLIQRSLQGRDDRFRMRSSGSGMSRGLRKRTLQNEAGGDRTDQNHDRNLLQ